MSTDFVSSVPTSNAPAGLPGDGRHDTTLVKPRRLGYATFETPDLGRAMAYFTEILGLHLAGHDVDRAFLTTRAGILTIVLERGDHSRCVGLAFEVPPASDFVAMSRQLAGENIRSVVEPDTVPGSSSHLVFQDPKGTRIELFHGCPVVGERHPSSGMSPLKLGHIAFCVADVLGIARFYSRIMGFKVSDWIGDDFVFMRCGADHHTVNFLSGKTVKLHHMAFELKDFAHIQTASDVLGEQRIPIIRGPLRLGAGHNVATYHRNYDDHVVELFAELDRMTDDELGYFEPRPWHRNTPQRPQIWDRDEATIWGTPPAPDYLRNRD